MHVHIAFAGKEPDPTLNTIKAIPKAIDRVVILYGRSDDGAYERTAETLARRLGEMGYPCESSAIRPFVFLDIVDTIYGVYERYSEEGSTTFSVDITSGTNLMSAAACNTAFFMDADVYYIMDQRRFRDRPLEELLVTIPSPRIPDARRLGGLSLDMLRFVAEEQDKGFEVCNADIARRFGMKPQAVMYHVGRLVDAGVVELKDAHTPKGEVDKRRKAIGIRREGRFVLRWA